MGSMSLTGWFFLTTWRPPEDGAAIGLERWELACEKAEYLPWRRVAASLNRWTTSPNPHSLPPPAALALPTPSLGSTRSGVVADAWDPSSHPSVGSVLRPFCGVWRCDRLDACGFTSLRGFRRAHALTRILLWAACVRVSGESVCLVCVCLCVLCV